MKVLFVGNSHTYFNDMPFMFREHCRAAGLDVSVTMLTRGGECLANHARSEQVLFNLRYGGYDYVVFQEVESDFPGAQVYMQSLTPLVEAARAAGTRPVLYMNFAPEASFERQEMLSAACRAAGEHFGLPVAAVGDAFTAVQKTHPGIDLYFTDRRHASAAGSYLISLCLAKTALGVEPVGLPGRIAFGGRVLVDLSAADALTLQEAAQEA